MFLLCFAVAFLLSVALISLHIDCDCMPIAQTADCCTPTALHIECECKQSTIIDFYPVCFLVINKLEMIKQLMSIVVLAFVIVTGAITAVISFANNASFKSIVSNIVGANVRMNN